MMMNKTVEKLKKLFPEAKVLGSDDPIYKEPPGILFAGIRKKLRKDKK
jgi:hypothetical protein